MSNECKLPPASAEDTGKYPGTLDLKDKIKVHRCVKQEDEQVRLETVYMTAKDYFKANYSKESPMDRLRAILKNTPGVDGVSTELMRYASHQYTKWNPLPKKT